MSEGYEFMLEQATTAYTAAVNAEGASQADKDRAAAQFRDKIVTIMRAKGQTEAAGRLAQVPADTVKAVADKIVGLMEAAAQQNTTQFGNLLAKDQNIIYRTMGGSLGMIDFAQSIVTLAKMFVPEDSEFGQKIARFEDRLKELRDEHRDDLNGNARTVMTADQMGRGTSILSQAVTSALGVVGDNSGSVPGAAGIGATGGTSHSGGRQPTALSLSTFIQAVRGDTTLSDDEKRNLVRAAGTAAKTDRTDGNDNQLSATEIENLQRTQAFAGLAEPKKAAVQAHLTLEMA